MQDVKKLLGKRIKEIRKSKGLTQEAVSEKIGIDSKSLSCIESGRNYPTPENIAKIASALDVKLFELFNFDHLEDDKVLLDKIVKGLKDNEKLTRLVYGFYSVVK